MELSDYDFQIVYKKGINNTNADALSSVKLDSDVLKTMIPHVNDESIKKSLVITRGMKNKMIHSKIINEEMDEVTLIEPDQFKM